MTDEMQADVTTLAHAVENLAQQLDVTLRNISNARLEMDRRDHVCELDGFERLTGDISYCELVSPFALEELRVLHPLSDRLVARQMPLNRLAEL